MTTARGSEIWAFIQDDDAWAETYYDDGEITPEDPDTGEKTIEDHVEYDLLKFGDVYGARQGGYRCSFGHAFLKWQENNQFEIITVRVPKEDAEGVRRLLKHYDVS